MRPTLDAIGALDIAGSRYAGAVTAALASVAGDDLVAVYLYAFVDPVLERLTERSGSAALRGVPEVEVAPRVTIVDDEPMVSCVLRTPANPELLALAARRFADQQRSQRELIVLEQTGCATRHALPSDDRVQAIVVPPEGSRTTGRRTPWRRRRARSSRPGTPPRGTQLTGSRNRCGSCYRPTRSGWWRPRCWVTTRRPARRERSSDPAALEAASLCARRHAWEQFGTAARLGERGDLAVTVARWPAVPRRTIPAHSATSSPCSAASTPTPSLPSPRARVPPGRPRCRA